jgi:HD superfamily phosphohydrolase
MTGLDQPLSTEPQQPVKAKVFRDPVHDLIYFTPVDRWLVDVIASKEFQRLRRIRQLGLAHLAYPGAEHSRFVHSLGVFDVARRMIRKLLHRHSEDPAIREELAQNMKTIKTAALLHDLGHGPFSHVFERAFGDNGGSLPKHDEWTCRILRDMDPDIEVSASLRKQGISIDDVCSLISDDEPPPREPYLRDIVSSQLDADRVDYLMRDSLMTGSRYGLFDAEWILNALVIAEPRIGDRSVKKLCLDASKGTGAIEGLLFARLQMYHYVYGHKTTRAYEAELVQTLRLAMRLSTQLPDETPAPVRTVLEKKGALTNKEYLLLDDEVMWWAIRRWASWVPPTTVAHASFATALKEHSLRLVRRHEPWRHRPIPSGEPLLAATRLYQRLVEKDDPLQYECFVDTLADLPYKDYRHYQLAGGGNERSFFQEIFVVRNGVAERLSKSENTPILEGLTREVEVCRFYFNRKFEKEFTGQLKKFGVC